MAVNTFLMESPNNKLLITECPRDAMQSFPTFIPTEKKIEYINSLLKVGFDALDFGSFVSPKAIPQLADTAEVIRGLKLHDTKTSLLAIVGNRRGAERACEFDEIQYLGYPFSFSSTFLQLNLHTNFQDSLKTIEDIQNLCIRKNKTLVVYFSLAFGNPYGDTLKISQLHAVMDLFRRIEIKKISLADTVGMAQTAVIEKISKKMISHFPEIDFSIHLHSKEEISLAKLEAAYNPGIRKFDSVLLGLGGCPMTARNMIGNIRTEQLIDFCRMRNIEINLNMDEFNKATEIALRIFQSH